MYLESWHGHAHMAQELTVIWVLVRITSVCSLNWRTRLLARLLNLCSLLLKKSGIILRSLNTCGNSMR